MHKSYIARYMSVLILIIVAASAFWVLPIVAQETPTAAPVAPVAFVTLSPQSGFPLDPFFVSLQGGGPVTVDSFAPGCPGFVTAAPSLTVDYKGAADLLRGFFYSDGDPVLVIQSPDGVFRCSDNTNEQLLDPTISLDKPAQGRYNVWVGSRIAKDLVPGVLVFTARPGVDLGTFALGSLIKRPSVPALLPMRERIEGWRWSRAAGALTPVPLQLGGAPITGTFSLEGDTPAVELTPGSTLCNGLVNVAPDFAFELPAGADAFNIFFEGDADSTLLVRDPNGYFVCADDASGADNLNPVIALTKAAPGNYLVWVGRLDPATPLNGILTVSPAGDARPQPLPKP